jgi:hypothetical protein
MARNFRWPWRSLCSEALSGVWDSQAVPPVKDVMPTSEEEKVAVDKKGLDLRFYITREPVILAVLSILVVVFFLAVTGLSRIYHSQQESLGTRWFTRGVADLQTRHYDRAVIEFRTALLYARDNYS